MYLRILFHLIVNGKKCVENYITFQDTVLTAAHCLIADNGTVVDPSKIVAVAGDHDLTKNDGTEQSATATQIRIHENYNP